MDWINQFFVASSSLDSSVQSKLWPSVFDQVVGHPDRALAFVERSLDRGVDEIRYMNLPAPSRFVMGVLDFVADQDLHRIAQKAIAHLESAPSETANRLINEIGIQYPRAFEGLFQRLFELRWRYPDVIRSKSRGGGTAIWDSHLDWSTLASPFLACSDNDVEWLWSRAESSDPLEQYKALSSLCETRRPTELLKALPRLLSLTQSMGQRSDRHYIGRSFYKTFEEKIVDFDFTIRPDGQLVQMFSETGYRIHFQNPGMRNATEELAHPTYQFTADEMIGTVTMGGATQQSLCGLCGNPLCIMFDRSELERPVEMFGPEKLVLCIGCLGYEVYELHYRHVDHEEPVALDSNDTKVQPDFPGKPPFEPFKATITRLKERWYRQGWSDQNDRIGGPPTWVQLPQYPACRGCNQPMKFVLQIDWDRAIPPRWLWVNDGMAYAFWCDKCSHSAWLLQHT